MNVIFIIPTGIGCEIGGHAGDATPAMKVIASLCDKIIINPNVVNASDINEMPENALYVEGSILDRFLQEGYSLKEISYNKILLIVNKPIRKETINAVNAARVTIGADIEICELNTPLIMEGFVNKFGFADGEASGIEEAIEQLIKSNYCFNALAIQTPIDVSRETKLNYFRNGGVNPWGRIEAIVSSEFAKKIDVPVAHAPLYIPNGDEEYETLHETLVSDPRMAAEMVSVCYLHCILKGLHKAPRIDRTGNGISFSDIDFMVSPFCYSLPHKLCDSLGVPIIYVRENKTIFNGDINLIGNSIMVDNYLEAAGFIASYKAGVNPKMTRRPILSV